MNVDDVEYKLLKRLTAGKPTEGPCSGSAYANKSKLLTLLGPDLPQKIAGKTVVDFGCGEGHEAIELAALGARRVIGIDIQPNMLSAARKNAELLHFDNVCSFSMHLEEQADVIVSIDSFEHFQDPAEVLRRMAAVLRPSGECLVAFGPTWYHPLGGHLFSVFPWAHLIFSEGALIRWRSDFKTDGATRFCEVAGGLNQMTIARFESLIRESPFDFRSLEAVPIRKLRRIHNSLTREFTTAIVRCVLAPKPRAVSGGSPAAVPA
jgi:SAM-dependent methyltransferase